MRLRDWTLVLKRTGRSIALFVVLLAGSWFLVSRSGNTSAWLTVVAPQFAAPGTTFPVQVHVTRAPTAAILRADLHWAVDRNSTKGFLAAGAGQPVTEAGGIFTFQIPVPPQPGLRFVTIVIYLSPDGNWNNHTFVATTRLIPIQITPPAGPTDLVTWPVFPLEENAPPRNPPGSSLPRYFTGIFWLIGALLFWNFQPLPPRWRRIGFGCLVLAALWELAGLEKSLGFLARNFARAEDVYYSRLIFQRAFISVVMASGIVLLFRARHQPLARGPFVCFGVYLMLAAINLVSLHAFDQVASQTWLGVTLVDLAKLLLASAALVGLFRDIAGAKRR